MTVHTLPPRLEKIAELISNSKVMADIGTDHAYLPVSLIARGKTEFAIASDIRTGPLKRAQATVNRYGMDDCVSLRLGPGLSTVTPEDRADTLVIAGMGGMIIADILEQSEGTVNGADLVILQPMTKVAEIREYIYEKGFSHIKEYIVKEGDKLYNIISFSPEKTVNKPLLDTEKILGVDTINSEYYDEYKKRQITKLRKTIDGLRRSENPQGIEEKERLLAQLSELE